MAYQTVDHGGYSLKNIQEFQGREGIGFSASLYLYGKKVGFVRNEANGGCLRYDPHSPKGTPPQEIGKAHRKMLADLKKHAIEAVGEDGPETHDYFIHHLWDDAFNEKRFKKLCKNKTLFRLEGMAEGEYMSVNAPFSENVKQQILDMYKKEGKVVTEFLNEKL